MSNPNNPITAPVYLPPPFNIVAPVVIGSKGEKGDPGEPGSDASVTNANVNIAIADSPGDTRTALGIGTLATQNGTFSGTSSGTNTGDQDLSGYALKSGTTFTGIVTFANSIYAADISATTVSASAGMSTTTLTASSTVTAAGVINTRYNIGVGSTLTLALTDNGGTRECGHAVGTVITVPLQASVAWPSNSVIRIRRGTAAGPVTFAGGPTIQGSALAATVPQGDTFSLIWVSSDVWRVDVVSVTNDNVNTAISTNTSATRDALGLGATANVTHNRIGAGIAASSSAALHAYGQTGEPSIKISAASGAAYLQMQGGGIWQDLGGSMQFVPAANGYIGFNSKPSGASTLTFKVLTGGVEVYGTLTASGTITSAGAIKPGSYTVAVANALVSPVAGSIIHVSNESGGACPAHYRGAWLRISDNTAIS